MSTLQKLAFRALFTAVLIACSSCPAYFHEADAGEPETKVSLQRGEVRESVELPKDCEKFADLISTRSFVDYVYAERDEIDLMLPTQSVRDRMVVIFETHLDRMQQYHRAIPGLLERTAADRKSDLSKLTTEVSTFLESQSNDLEELLRAELNGEQLEKVLNRVIYLASPEFYQVDILVREIGLTEQQVVKLASSRQKQRSIIESDPSNGKFTEPWHEGEPQQLSAKTLRKLIYNDAITIDILTEPQLTRVWSAKGHLELDESIEGWIRRRKNREGFEDFISYSKLLTDVWNRIHPNAKIVPFGENHRKSES